jgi:hypothetical protein
LACNSVRLFIAPNKSNHTHWLFNFLLLTVGRVNLCSPDHISLLVHRTFNVSIPRHHIPTDHWEFEYGAAENDPEFGPQAAAGGGEQSEEGSSSQGEEGGKWIHSITGEKLGGLDGFLEFTVIGQGFLNYITLTTVLIISLIGSRSRMRCSRYEARYSPTRSLLPTYLK